MPKEAVANFLGVVALEEDDDHRIEESHEDESESEANVDGPVPIERAAVESLVVCLR